MAKREFYRVLPQYDGRKYKRTQYNHVHYEELIRNELITPYMVKKHNIPLEWLAHEYYSTSETYWFFGARFSIRHTYSEYGVEPDEQGVY